MNKIILTSLCILASITANSQTPWYLAGNAGTNPPSDFLGTTDNKNLVFKVNNGLSGLIDLAYFNTSFGEASLLNNSTSPYNTAIGYQSLNANTGSTGGNTAVGYKSLLLNTTGFRNDAIGHSALYSNTTGVGNESMGFEALYNNTTGWRNIGVGYNALRANTTAYDNTAVGAFAGLQVSGTGNTLIGSQCYYNTTSGSYNSVVGLLSSYSGGNSVVSVGAYSHYGPGSASTSYLTTAVGTSSLYLLNGDTSVTALGDNTAASNGLKNSTVIGSRAYVTQDNSLVLGSINGVNGATADTKVGIGTTAPRESLDVIGNGGYTGSLVVGDNTYSIPSDYKLAVKDGIITEKVRIRLYANWPDFVFNEGYDLLPISKLEAYILQNKHLPGIEPASQVETEGVEVGDMLKKAMQKIEELSLYIIQLNKKIERLDSKGSN